MAVPPLNSFSSRSRTCTCVKSPNCGGIGPLSRFPRRLSRVTRPLSAVAWKGAVSALRSTLSPDPSFTWAYMAGSMSKHGNPRVQPRMGERCEGGDAAIRTGNRRGIGRSKVRIYDAGSRTARTRVQAKKFQKVSINLWTADIREADGMTRAGQVYVPEENAELVSLAMGRGHLN